MFSGLPSTTDIAGHGSHGRNVPILLQKSEIEGIGAAGMIF
jgi:hypothetical protein